MAVVEGVNGGRGGVRVVRDALIPGIGLVGDLLGGEGTGICRSPESRHVGLVGVRVAPLLAVVRGEPPDRLSLH